VSIVITDPKLIAELDAATGTVALTDPTGRFLATVTPHGQLPPGVESPFSDEEIERRRTTYTAGRPSADIFKRLRRE